MSKAGRLQNEEKRDQEGVLVITIGSSSGVRGIYCKS